MTNCAYTSVSHCVLSRNKSRCPANNHGLETHTRPTEAGQPIHTNANSIHRHTHKANRILIFSSLCIEVLIAVEEFCFYFRIFILSCKGSLTPCQDIRISLLLCNFRHLCFILKGASSRPSKKFPTLIYLADFVVVFYVNMKF